MKAASWMGRYSLLLGNEPPLKGRDALFWLQRPPVQGSPPNRASQPQEDSRAGPLVETGTQTGYPRRPGPSHGDMGPVGRSRGDPGGRGLEGDPGLGGCGLGASKQLPLTYE